MTAEQQLDSALDLMRRLPPQDCKRHLGLLIDLNPELCQDLLAAIDQPLKIAYDSKAGMEFLICDYNRDGDSHRSPWSSAYFPPLEDGVQPSERLRKLEIEANEAFKYYREMYYEGGISSVYVWELDHGFASVVLIKKSGDKTKMAEGCWDSVHVIEVQEKTGGRGTHYKLTSTVLLWLRRTSGQDVDLSGSLTRQLEMDSTPNDSANHVINMGRMVEEMENKMRSSLSDVYFCKTNDIVNVLRSIESQTELNKQYQLQNEIARAIHNRQDIILNKRKSLSLQEETGQL